MSEPRTEAGKRLLAGRFARSLVCSIADHARCDGHAPGGSGDDCNCPCHFADRILAIEAEAADRESARHIEAGGCAASPATGEGLDALVGPTLQPQGRVPVGERRARGEPVMRDEQIAAIAAALHGRITKRHYWYANATKIECDDGEAEESEATALYDAGLHRAADDVTATAPSDSGVTPSSARPSAGDIRDAEDLIDREDDGFGTAAAWNILQRRDEWDAYDAAHRAEQPEKGRVLPTRQRPILSIDPEEGRDGR